MPGMTGDVIVPLFPGGVPDTSTRIGITGKIDVTSIAAGAVVCGIQTIAGLWAAMGSGNVYINVHSDMNPSGEIRGDIMEGVMEGAKFMAIPLSGDAQVPPVMTSASGTITMAYSAFAETIVYSLVIANPDAIALYGAAGVHIHCGGVGMNGDVVVTLVPGGNSDSSLTVALTSEINNMNVMPGVCDDVLDIPTLWMAMMDGVPGLYVNVHSEPSPNGEIRGDIGVPAMPMPTAAPVMMMMPTTAPVMMPPDMPSTSTHVISVNLSGDQEVPPVASSAMGTATFIYSSGCSSILFTLDIMNDNGLGIWGAAGTWSIVRDNNENTPGFL